MERQKVYIPGKIGRDHRVGNAATIVVKESINGSGATKFGGAKRWPCVTARVELQEGQEELAERIRQIIEDTLMEE